MTARSAILRWTPWETGGGMQLHPLRRHPLRLLPSRARFPHLLFAPPLLFLFLHVQEKEQRQQQEGVSRGQEKEEKIVTQRAPR